MFENLKKCLLIELKKETGLLIEEKDQLNNDVSGYSSKKNELITKSNSIQNDKRYIDFINNYSKISKFFNKAKFTKEKKDLCNSIKEEYTKMQNDLSDKYNSDINRIKEIERRIEKIKEKLVIIDKAQNVQQLSISFEEAEALFNKNNINIYDYSYDDILSLGDSKSTTGNISFMKQAINNNPFNIVYDRTNDYEMYYSFIRDLNYQDNTSNDQIFNTYKQKVLDILDISKKGETKIKPVYLLEAIRYYFKDVVINSAGQLEKGDLNQISDALHHIASAYDRTQKLSDHDYYQLENMYNPKENDYYCHKTSSNTTNEQVESILTNGLKVSGEWGTGFYIGANARKIDCFLAITGYDNYYGGHGGGNDRIIIEIPKETVYPIGSNNKDGNDLHILPEYTIAHLHDTLGNNGLESSSLIVNDKERKKYNYLYKDGYVNNDYEKIPIENPNISSEDESAKAR